jgi:hypothetical protein
VEGAQTPAGVRGWGDPTGASARPLKKSVKFYKKQIPEKTIPTSSLKLVEKSIEFSHFDIGKWRNFGIRFFGNFIIKQKKYFFSGFRFSAEEAPRHARGKQAPGTEINHQF